MYKNSKFTIILPAVVACSLVAGVLLGGLVFRTSRPVVRRPALTAPGSDKINRLLSLIGTQYVDSVSIDSLTERVIPLILDELDPHSTYLSAQDLSRAKESIEGEFDGIGVVFNMATDTVIVLNVGNSGPSAKAGIQAGDRIVTVNDTVVAGIKMPQDSVVKRLRGPRGSQVTLGIQRAGVKDLVPFVVTRDAIPIKSIVAAYMIRPETGYIKFEQFSMNAHKELAEAIARLKEQGMKKLILDVRGNPGGLLDQAILISREFLPKGKMIVYTQDRDGNREIEYSEGNGKFMDEELVVLIDENSASASEILAGALQDNDRGTIIGRRSFGKGLVQNQIPFPDGSAVRLTVARYYTPTGRSIQKPYSNGREDYYNELLSRYQHDEMFSADSIHFADSLKYTTESGRVVYGGGGIMPDIFVPVDTTDMTPYFREVAGRSILYKFTLEFSDRYRGQLNKIRSLEELDRFFDRQPNLLNEFVSYAAKAGVAPKPAEIERSKAILLAQLKAYIGRNTELEDNAFYHEIQGIDNVIARSIEVLDSAGHAGS
nr:S41 family peptidase [uncultured Alistipes sp.]